MENLDIRVDDLPIQLPWYMCVPQHANHCIIINATLNKAGQQFVIDNLVAMLIHEHLHQVLVDEEGYPTSKQFDDFFGNEAYKKLGLVQEFL